MSKLLSEPRLHEFNPMLGHRGCGLGITYPEITEMQARAIFEAAVAVAKQGVKVFPEVMIPLTATRNEMANQAAIVNGWLHARCLPRICSIELSRRVMTSEVS